MRLLFLLSLPLLLAVAFLLGRATRPATASAARTGHVYSGRLGDVFSVRAAAMRCAVSAEAGAADVLCSHLPTTRARYQVVYFKDNLLVYRVGRPDDPVFSARGRP
jgi:hypothetical protein